MFRQPLKLNINYKTTMHPIVCPIMCLLHLFPLSINNDRYNDLFNGVVTIYWILEHEEGKEEEADVLTGKITNDSNLDLMTFVQRGWSDWLHLLGALARPFRLVAVTTRILRSKSALLAFDHILEFWKMKRWDFFLEFNVIRKIVQHLLLQLPAV